MSVNDPNSYADDPGAIPQDPTAGLDTTVRIAAPQMPAMYPAPPLIQTSMPAAGIPSYVYQGGPYYGDQQAQMTQMRASYGDMPMIAMGGMATAGSGAAAGLGNMFAAIGANVAPVTYTPPARVLTGYAGRYVQNVGVLSDIKNVLGLHHYMGGAYSSDIRYNAASDLGERIALATSGAALSIAGAAAAEGGAALGGLALGGVGSIAGGLGAFYLAGAATDRVQKGVAQRREIMNYLEQTSDRYITAGGPMADPRRGAGFSSGARREVTEFIRGMDLRDPMMNTEELTKILKESTQMGLFTGVHEMDDFKKRFKDVVENVKVVAKTLHSTLEEGVRTIHDLRAVGIRPDQAAAVVQQAGAMGLASGRSAGEMLNLGLQGAELFRGTGINMQIGFESNIMNAAAIRSARDAKLLSDEAIAQAGGEEALAQRMTASSLGFAQTSQGRGMMGMFFNPALAGTGFDPGSFDKMVAGGGGNFYANVQNAARNLSTPAGTIKFQANQEAMFSEMGKQFGGKGLDIAMDNFVMMQAVNMSKITGAAVDDSFKTILKRQLGISDTEANTRLAEIKNADQAFQTAQAGVEAQRIKVMQDQASQNFFWNRVGATIEKGITSATDVVSRPINNLVEGVREAAMNASDVLSGVQRVNSAGTNAALFLGEAGSAQTLVGPSGVVDVSPAFLSQWSSLAPSAGADLANLLAGGGTNALGLKTSAPGGAANLLIKKEGLLGKRTAISYADLERAQKTARRLSTTLSDAEQAGDAIKDESAAASAAILANMGTAKDINRAKDVNELSTSIFGKTVENLTDAEYKALLVTTKGNTNARDVTEAGKRLGDAAIATWNEVSVARQAKNLEDARSAGVRFSADISDAMFQATGEHVAMTVLPQALIGNLAQLRQASSPAARAAAELAVRKTAGGLTGADAPRIQENIGTIISQAMGPAGIELNGVVSNDVAYNLEQLRRGREIQGQVITGEVFAKLSKPEERAEVVKALDQVKDRGVEGVMAITDRQASLLEQTPSGSLLVQEKKLATFIQQEGEKSVSASTFKEDVRVAGFMPAGAQLDQLSSAYADNTKKAMALSEAQTMDRIAGQQNIATSGTTAGVGTATGTADQQAATQMAINVEILSAMRALATRLGVH